MLILIAGNAFAADAPAPLVLDRAYITGDTAWSGTVILKGQNVVKRGATLTILPGTAIKFVRTDENNDGIGDGELTVEGRLVAKGTKDSRIEFSSAEASSAPKDWTFIILSHADESVMEYCRIRHAFTGVQVHWTRATIKNCEFTENFEGMRFSTAALDFSDNKVSGNSFGIRYETRNSKATIAGNDITGNGCGFFAAIKCEGDVTVRGNNITNEEYDVKLGDRQTAGLDFTGNWWGSAAPEAIVEKIFDGRREAGLGVVAIEPFLPSPVKGAGVK